MTVISTIRGYGDYLWYDVVERVDAMGSQVNEFQAQSKRLPKVRRWEGRGRLAGGEQRILPACLVPQGLMRGAFSHHCQPPTAAAAAPQALRDWLAYKDCRRTIDDFLEMLPLFQALTHKSIRDRWAGRKQQQQQQCVHGLQTSPGEESRAIKLNPTCKRASRALPTTPAATAHVVCRHWKELMQITARQLNLAEDVFKLQHLLDAGMLEHRCGGREGCVSMCAQCVRWRGEGTHTVRERGRCLPAFTYELTATASFSSPGRSWRTSALRR